MSHLRKKVRKKKKKKNKKAPFEYRRRQGEAFANFGYRRRGPKGDEGESEKHGNIE